MRFKLQIEGLILLLLISEVLLGPTATAAPSWQFQHLHWKRGGKIEILFLIDWKHSSKIQIFFHVFEVSNFPFFIFYFWFGANAETICLSVLRWGITLVLRMLEEVIEVIFRGKPKNLNKSFNKTQQTQHRLRKHPDVHKSVLFTGKICMRNYCLCLQRADGKSLVPATLQRPVPVPSHPNHHLQTRNTQIPSCTALLVQMATPESRGWVRGSARSSNHPESHQLLCLRTTLAHSRAHPWNHCWKQPPGAKPSCLQWIPCPKQLGVLFSLNDILNILGVFSYPARQTR